MDRTIINTICSETGTYNLREKIGAVQAGEEPLEAGGSRPWRYWPSTAILLALTGHIRWLSNLRIFSRRRTGTADALRQEVSRLSAQEHRGVGNRWGADNGKPGTDATMELLSRWIVHARASNNEASSDPTRTKPEAMDSLSRKGKRLRQFWIWRGSVWEKSCRPAVRELHGPSDLIGRVARTGASVSARTDSVPTLLLFAKLEVASKWLRCRQAGGHLWQVCGSW